ncbi:hypothetical protein FQA39_LY13419 [Lamprigera yunnana]|nr:hypothetical protein FQA39_LY13419 [Lamprigera yunnana]
MDINNISTSIGPGTETKVQREPGNLDLNLLKISILELSSDQALWPEGKRACDYWVQKGKSETVTRRIPRAVNKDYFVTATISEVRQPPVVAFAKAATISNDDA